MTRWDLLPSCLTCGKQLIQLLPHTTTAYCTKYWHHFRIMVWEAFSFTHWNWGETGMASINAISVLMVRVFLCSPYRRTVPLIHPHNWHLVKLAEEPSVPGSAGSSDGPLAMQLHPTPFSVPWHSGGDRWGSIYIYRSFHTLTQAACIVNSECTHDTSSSFIWTSRQFNELLYKEFL